MERAAEGRQQGVRYRDEAVAVAQHRLQRTDQRAFIANHLGDQAEARPCRRLFEGGQVPPFRTEQEPRAPSVGLHRLQQAELALQGLIKHECRQGPLRVCLAQALEARLADHHGQRRARMQTQRGGEGRIAARHDEVGAGKRHVVEPLGRRPGIEYAMAQTRRGANERLRESGMRPVPLRYDNGDVQRGADGCGKAEQQPGQQPDANAEPPPSMHRRAYQLRLRLANSRGSWR